MLTKSLCIAAIAVSMATAAHAAALPGGRVLTAAMPFALGIVQHPLNPRSRPPTSR